jgi:hypothetical protein
MTGSTQARLYDLKHAAIVAVFVVSMGHLNSSAAQDAATQQRTPAVWATLDPKVIAILRASCNALSSAQTMTFTAVDTFERAAHNGQPLYHTVLDHVTMQRPDKLRVLKLGDGIPNEFYYDGKTMTVYVPLTNSVAIADAPPIIDQLLAAAWNVAGIYFPFAHVLVSQPCSVLDGNVKSAFYVGQSTVVGGIKTDVVAVTGSNVQAQLWIGVADHLPRMLLEIYSNAPGHTHYRTDYSDWHLDTRVEAGDFGSDKADAAKRIPFEPAGASPPPTRSLSRSAQAPTGAAPDDQPLPPRRGDGKLLLGVQKASLIGD